MLASRTLLILLTLVYFIVPVGISELIFQNDFYIYSNSQSTANIRSLIYGVIFIAWTHYLFRPQKNYKNAKNANKLVNWSGCRVAFFLMILYCGLLIVYGQQLRSFGASREELLGGMDEFLLPGMSFILLGASVYAVARAKAWQFYSLFILFLLIDATYNGKIFSFIALILFFVRLDYSGATKKIIAKYFAIWLVLGLSMLLLSGLTRISLAGDSLNINPIGIAYLFGSEFLGVQSSIGWGIDYYNQGYSPVFWSFGSTLEDFYKSSVGHGLATSPGAFFEANFGNAGPLLATLTCALSLILFRLSTRSLGWIAYLIVAINYQHFLRHGLDVFTMKVVTQMCFASLVAKLIYSNKLMKVEVPLRKPQSTG